jgi:DNA-binding GntR family transcriptional regulator
MATETRSKVIEPIRSRDDIERVRRVLREKPRDLLLFDLAVETGIGMKQLLTLKVRDFENMQSSNNIRGEQVHIPAVSKRVSSTWRSFYNLTQPDEHDYVFKSRKGSATLNLSSVSSMVSSWFKKAGLDITGGARVLQKTWAFHHRDRIQPEDGSGDRRDSISSIHPVRIETVKEKVYRELSRAIFTGRLAPGERLLEEKIADRMQVSRMPVREALHRLEEAGFVSPNRSSGKVVNRLSRQDLEEITHIRVLLECEAARIATEKRGEASLKRLEKVNSEMNTAVDNNDIDKVLGLNKHFHMVLYEDAHMPILQQIIGAMWDRVSPYIHILMREGDSPALGEQVKRNHKGILEGFGSRSTRHVCSWITQDIFEGRDTVSSLLESLNSNGTRGDHRRHSRKP